METLIFPLIASYGAHQQQEQVVAEPEEFRPFRLQKISAGISLIILSLRWFGQTLTLGYG
ncbi:MAG: hypothetical protein JO251_09105 [Verrucomicrobia bacterium]|nr:hypothetical protein [Verrucomicrobiota bacterium]